MIIKSLGFVLVFFTQISAFTPPTRLAHVKDFTTSTSTSSSINVLPLDSSFMESASSFHVPISTPSLFPDMTSTLISHEREIPHPTGISLVDNILVSTAFWSSMVMFAIISLLLLWEESIHTLRHKLPQTLTVVVDSMLGEIGGLGFIGLFLELCVTSSSDRGIGRILGEISEEFLGESEILLEVFENLHNAFFEVGIAFFLVMGTVVFAVLKRIGELSEISKLAIDTDGDGEVTLEELADALNVESLIVDLDGDGKLSDDEIKFALQKVKNRNFFGEASLTAEERASEILLIRQEFLLDHNLTDSFQIEKYFEQIFGHNLEEMVELSPLTWIPLIPLLSLLNSIDLDNEIVSASSLNAAASSGLFITSQYFFMPSVVFTLVGLAWGVFNFWKMKKVKNMLIPTLVKDGINGPATLLPPRYQDKELRSAVNTSPGPIAFIERMVGGKKARNKHEELFGVAGQNAPEIYRTSIKFHTWLCVAQIVFFTNQIVFRDYFALLDYNSGLLSADAIGDFNSLVPELGLYFVFVILAILQLFLAPTSFLNYCTATSTEFMTQTWALDIAIKESMEKKSESIKELVPSYLE